MSAKVKCRFCLILITLACFINPAIQAQTDLEPYIKIQRLNPDFPKGGPSTAGSNKDWRISYEAYYIRGLNKKENALFELTQTYKLPLLPVDFYTLASEKHPLNENYELFILSYRFKPEHQHYAPDVLKPFSEALYIVSKAQKRVVGYCLIEGFDIESKPEIIQTVEALPENTDFQAALNQYPMANSFKIHEHQSADYIELYGLFKDEQYQKYVTQLALDAYLPKEVYPLIKERMTNLLSDYLSIFQPD